MDTFEIRDEEINVEDIMRQIRENIRKRKESGAYNNEKDALINKPLQKTTIRNEKNDLQQNLDCISSNWDINAEYEISSHRPIIGKLLVFGRQLIHNEVRRYVDLIIGKQTEFNSCVTSILNYYTKIINDINKDINNKVWLANLLEEQLKKKTNDPLPQDMTNGAMNYYSFEDKFRGSLAEIKTRQSIFIDYFRNCHNVLDIGFGRGEFLSLLKESGIEAKGIDINNDMVQHSLKNGLDVKKEDALLYLHSLENDSLDGVFSGQVIEHLQPTELIRLVKLCHDKMKKDAYFIAETVNPTCLSVSASSFYIDLSHVKPIHPETIKFLLESVGFKEIEFKFFSPFPEDFKLHKLNITEEMPANEIACHEIFNNNMDKLNSLLYGYQDYAVIAKK